MLSRRAFGMCILLISFIPMMIRIKRLAVSTMADKMPASFLSLLGAIVAPFAQGLKVVRVVEQYFIAPVRLLMVYHLGRHGSPMLLAELAERLLLKLIPP